MIFNSIYSKIIEVKGLTGLSPTEFFALIAKWYLIWGFKLDTL